MKFETQRDATYHAVVETLKNNKINFVPNKTDVSTIITRGSEIRKQVIAMLVGIFTNKQAPLAREQKDLAKYCSGLLNNWMHRDSALNGGKDYVPNVGSHDGQIREMMKLASLYPDKAAEINAAIEARKAEVIAARKVTNTPKPDLSKIPADLLKQLKLA